MNALTILFIAVLMVAMGVQTLLAAYRAHRDYQAFRAHGEAVKGTVIALHERTTEQGTTTFAPVVRFAASDRSERQFTSRHGYYPALHQIGQEVEVVILNGDTENAEINAANTDKNKAWAFAGLGVLLISFAAIMMIYAWPF